MRCGAKAGIPVAQRPCEVELEKRVNERPLPTMQLGVLTGRAVALTRRLRARGKPPCSIERQEILEVYPRATLRRLAQATSASRRQGGVA